MLYVVLVTNNEGGCPATLHETLESAKAWIRQYLADGDPPLSPEEQRESDNDLASLTGECVDPVRGSQAWKEWIYVAPVKGLGTIKTEGGLVHFGVDASGLRATRIGIS